jgi:hypothetical protein
MDAPPVQYVRSSDGYSIAFTVCGEGLPFVLMPEQASHAQLAWTAKIQPAWLPGLRDRFRLICYDGRGQGMSQRGLRDFSLSDCRRDLETVVDHLGLDRFILSGQRYKLMPLGPRYIWRSLPHIPDAFISTTTSPRPGTGSGISINSTVRSPPKVTPRTLHPPGRRLGSNRLPMTRPFSFGCDIPALAAQTVMGWPKWYQTQSLSRPAELGLLMSTAPSSRKLLAVQ